MNQLAIRDTELQTVSELRRQLLAIVTPTDALKTRDSARLFADAVKLVGQSVQQCNEYSEIYLEAFWLFGEMVKDNPAHRPEKAVIDNGLTQGTEMQRKYARKFARAVQYEDIPTYIEQCNTEGLHASVAGCMGGEVHNHLAKGTGENEWYTPLEYIQLARKVMGSITLDAASSAEAQKRVCADNYFSKADNALAQPWYGNVWLNPPYSRDLMGLFIEKLIAELANVDQLILLTHNYTDTQWFQGAEEHAARICFTAGRVRFVDRQGAVSSPTQGQAFFYFGRRLKKFETVFGDIGFVR